MEGQGEGRQPRGASATQEGRGKSDSEDAGLGNASTNPGVKTGVTYKCY